MKKVILNKKAITSKELPNPFIPASSDFFKEMFYWDSFFITTGLITEKEAGYNVAKGIVENFAYLIKKKGYVPNSVKYSTRSQPPFFSSAVALIYEHTKDKKWLKKIYPLIKKEYKYWNSRKHKTKEKFLLRYNDPKEKLNKTFGKSYGAIQESGWDMTLRFEDKCQKVAALDLNCLIYKQLKDLEFFAKELENKKDELICKNKSLILKKKINKLFFNKKEKLYFDYIPEEKKQLTTKTLATFFPLFAKIATKKQAKDVKNNLKLFEKEFGLTTTTKDLERKGYQWGYPNGWAPLHYIAIYGLLNYGFKKDAFRIAKKYTSHLEKIKGWPEKTSVVKNKKTINDPRYNHQKELYWTAGVYKNLINLINNSQ